MACIAVQLSLLSPGFPMNITMAEVYSESDGHTAWSSTFVTPYHGDAGAL
jgi:hypothetical protein